ncbi:MAG: hypothetical protein FH762_07220 [Firmicutes bacterium]|nr:hypothetical protein [Bacillota bacterium]
MTLFEQIINEDNEKIKDRIKLREEHYRLHVIIDNQFSGISYFFYPDIILKRDYYYIAIEIIIKKVTEDYLDGNVSPSYKKIVNNKNDSEYSFRVIPSKKCRNLLSAMYLQFLLVFDQE